MEESEVTKLPPNLSDGNMHDTDDNRPFIEVKRRKRRHRHHSGTSTSSESTVISVTSALNELTVILKPTDSNKLITKLHPVKLSEYLESVAPDGILQIRPNLRLNLLALDTRNSESTKALLGVTAIGGIPVRAYQPRSLDNAVGVIRGLPEDMSDNEILQSTRGAVQVMKARRLGTSEVVQLVFQTSTLPEHVCVGYTRFKVLPYTDKPRQCTKCHRFGHIESTCQASFRCVRCGKQHDRKECTAEQPRCPNCGREHESTSRRCPAFRTEEAISKYRSENGVGYIPAREAIVPSKPGKSNAQRTRHFPSHNTVDKASASQKPGAHRGTQVSQGDSHSEVVNDEVNFPQLPVNVTLVKPDKPSVRRERSSKTPGSSASQIGSTLPNLAMALNTLLSMLRNVLQLIDLPFARSIITLLDAAMPLTGLLAS